MIIYLFLAESDSIIDGIFYSNFKLDKVEISRGLVTKPLQYTSRN